MTQVGSVFSQLWQLFSRREFARAVHPHRAERNAQGFSGWGQFVALLFGPVAQRKSLREIGLGWAGGEAPLQPLGLDTTPQRSTLA